ncbi:MAG TPA: hypothetical protein PK286_02890 [Devosia sp.]|nr:hypothetical protein [Devosia sp.]
MKRLIITAFAAAVLLAGPAAVVSSSGALAQGSCGPDAPEAWFRPGGFCAQIGSGNSLSGPVDPGCTPYRYPEAMELGMAAFPKGERVQVAEAHCCDYAKVRALIPQEMPVGDRLHMAMVPIDYGCGSSIW